MFASSSSRATLMAKRLLALSSTTKIPAVSWLEADDEPSAVADVIVRDRRRTTDKPDRTCSRYHLWQPIPARQFASSALGTPSFRWYRRLPPRHCCPRF